ncbi:FeoB-associated Cys-rich membrane protein [Salinithrix halophila]|uniref:FeoB-associated Cys-rich membrane protein n=1 Tax=Salinithrix halophila TaxID=1485204 RepID=A0ABV8JD58_9BACL
MIYLVIAAVLGFAAWQLVSFVRRLKNSGSACSSGGCSGCPSSGNCSIQDLSNT